VIITSLRNDMITHLLRSGTWSKPTIFGLALFSTTPAADGTGGVEVTGIDYTRRAINQLDANWTEPVAGVTTNVNAVEFNTPASDWGSVTAVVLMNSTSIPAGGPRMFYELPNPITVLTGDSPLIFPAGTLRFTID